MTKRFQSIMIGADPELFLQNPNDGGFVSAHEYVKGTKEVPFPVNKGAVQLDGTSAEFNIYPARTVEEFTTNISTVMDELREMTRGSGYNLVAAPVADFDPVYWDNHVPEDCKLLGCTPDFDAWELRPNDAPDAGQKFRTGSGHIHLGWGEGFDPMDPDHFDACAEVARQLDYYVGIYSLLWDEDNRRRELYGRAGAFRPKSYGVEYRTLSNAWLNSQLLQIWVFRAAKAALEDMDDGLKMEDIFGDLARDIINGGDRDWWKDNSAPRISRVPFPPGFNSKAA